MPFQTGNDYLQGKTRIRKEPLCEKKKKKRAETKPAHPPYIESVNIDQLQYN
jgi:hypothetical protein